MALTEDHSNTLFFCFCGPGASGKSTICRELVAADKSLRLSVSTTSRLPRGKEAEGVAYYFVSKEEFQSRVHAGQFIEHATFGGNQYGTEVSNIVEAKRHGQALVLDIEYQGAAQLKERFREQVVTIFVFPPSFTVLEERFRSRGEDDESRIQERLKIARQEISKLSSPGFSDYFLVNDQLASSVSLAQAIIAAERARFARLSEQARKLIFGQ